MGGEKKHHTDLPIKTSPKVLKDGFVSRDVESFHIIYLFQHCKNPRRFAPAGYLYLINTVTTGSQISINFLKKMNKASQQIICHAKLKKTEINTHLVSF